MVIYCSNYRRIIFVASFTVDIQLLKLIALKVILSMAGTVFFSLSLCDEAMDEFEVDLATDTEDPRDIGGRVRIKTKFSGLSWTVRS